MPAIGAPPITPVLCGSYVQLEMAATDTWIKAQCICHALGCLRADDLPTGSIQLLICIARLHGMTKLSA
jgi:hypothetical protein